MRVASIAHRDIASLGLAWAYIYRQPLAAGEGIIGQVVATGYPSLTTNIGSAQSGISAATDMTSYHTPWMQLASLLILPLRTRRETIGALVIAANDPSHAMAEIPNINARIMAATEPQTDAAPLIPHSHDAALFDREAANFIPSGKGIPMNSPRGATSATEAAIRIDMRAAPRE